MIKKFIYILLVTILLADVGYSFLQHYYTPFDGDMAGGIVPAEDVKPILESPLGLKIFTDHTTYPNPNKFFSHWSFNKYFNHVPILLQNFTSPINSAYLSCAISKTMIQCFLILLISFFIAGINFKLDFILAAVLITPLFQTNGYRSYMGIIDPSTTYTFFYALPTILILLYFLPLFLKHFYGFELKNFKYIKFIWVILAIICSLSGPLNPGIALIASVLIFLERFFRNLRNSDKWNSLLQLKLAFQNIPKDYYFYLIPISVFSMYSLFLGRYNSLDLSNQMSLSVLYSRLPEGIYYTISQKIGFPVLLISIIINTLIIKYRFKTPNGIKLLKLLKWIALFSLLYILLLPLGGYREYRPFILRYDTIIPITLCLMFVFGKTTIFILNNISRKQKYGYIPLIIFVLFVFTNSDKPNFDKNSCERNAILQIANSTDSIVKIEDNCNVLSWKKIENPAESELNVKLLQIWKIIDDDKLYFQN